MSDLVTREFHVRADTETEGSAREVSGIAVPWDTDADIAGQYTERFERGSIQDSDGAMLFWRHDEPIGRITSYRDTDEGWEITAHISETPRGDEAYTLIRDGVITKFSVGFQPVEHREDEDGTIVRTKVRVREVSLVPMPAYESASINEVRENQNISKETTQMADAISVSDFDEVRETVETLERKYASLEVTDREPAADTRSAGEVLKAIASGDESTIRAYSGGTTADSVVKNGFVGDLTRLVDQAATMRSVFATGALPSEGNFIEYAQLKSNSMTFAQQANEGDDLTYGKVAIETKTAPVKTFGGYTQLSRQEIERSSVNILDANLRAQAIAAGKALNVVLRAEYSAEHALQVTAGNTVSTPSLATAGYADWLDAAVDAAVKFDNQGLSLDALITDPATFKGLLNIEAEDGRPVFTVSGQNGQNTAGTLNVKGLRGELASIPVVLDAGLGTNKVAFINSNALRFYGSPLVRLQDDNIINLTKDFSIYTYAAVAHEIPAGIVPVVFGA